MKSRLNARNCGGILAGCLLVAFLLTGCDSVEENHETQISKERLGESFTDAAFELGMRGALLASRFETLEDFQKVVLLDFLPREGESGDSMVVISTINYGELIQSRLSQGVSEGTLSKASVGNLGDKLAAGLEAPEAVQQRNQLKQILLLSRRRPFTLGEGDPAFFDLALAMVDHISTPSLAYMTERDSSEKGYLNTFNHITAQAFITSMYSEEIAEFVAVVHERKTMPELITGRFTSSQLSDPDVNPVDNYVDILNNEWGQELGVKLSDQFKITSSTSWSPELLADYLNEIQRYYCYSFHIGMRPFFPNDSLVRVFSTKLNYTKSLYPD